MGKWSDEKGVRNWQEGETFRPGKTRHEHESGVHMNHLRNKEDRRAENRRRANRAK